MATIGADLVRQMAAGDRDAFAVFYDHYAPVVFPLILRIVRERADARDVLQEGFWVAWRGGRPWPSGMRAPAGRRVTPRRGASRPRPLVWVVGTVVDTIAVAAFTGAFVATRYEARLGQMAGETAALHARVQREEAALREELAVYRSAVDLLRDPQAQVVNLRGLGPSPEATGRVIWHPAHGGYVFVAHLPSAPPGQAYELWSVGDAAPQPAGLFQVDASGRAAHRIAPVQGGTPVKVFAVTLEVEAGVQQPEGPMVLASAK